MYKKYSAQCTACKTCRVYSLKSTLHTLYIVHCTRCTVYSINCTAHLTKVLSAYPIVYFTVQYIPDKDTVCLSYSVLHSTVYTWQRYCLPILQSVDFWTTREPRRKHPTTQANPIICKMYLWKSWKPGEKVLIIYFGNFLSHYPGTVKFVGKIRDNKIEEMSWNSTKFLFLSEE